MSLAIGPVLEKKLARKKAQGVAAWLRLVWLLMLSSFLPAPAQAVAATARPIPGQIAASTVINSPALVLAYTTCEYRLGRHWDVLAVRHDSVGNVSFAQVTSPAWAARFRHSQQDVLSYGEWRGQVWLRTTVVNQASGHTAWLLRARLSSFDDLTVYLLRPNGQVQLIQTGPAMSFAHSHNVPDRHINLALSLPSGQPVTLYVRTRGGLLNFSICERRTLEEGSYWESLFLAIFLGAMLMLGVWSRRIVE